MTYRILADVVVLLHLLFIALVVGGSLLAWRWPRLVWLHLPAVLWGVAIELLGWVCPLTPLENTLRRAAGQHGYGGDFVEHYVLPVIYPGILTREIQVGLGVAVLVVNVAAYALLWRRRTR